MAAKNDTPPPAPAADGAVAPKRKLGKILLIAGVVVVLLAAAAGGAFFMLSKNQPADGEDGTETSAEEKPKKKKAEKKSDHKPAYSALDPFTVNLNSDAGDQYLQVALTLDMEDAATAEHTKLYMAKIRNDIMLHLSGKKPADLATKEGKQQLASELRGLINAILDPDSKGRKDASGPVREVLFTSFIIQ